MTAAEIERMRQDHVDDGAGYCALEKGWDYETHFPCDAALLIAHFAPGPVPHLAAVSGGWTSQPVTGAQHDAWMRGEAYGICGPSTMEELAR